MDSRKNNVTAKPLKGRGVGKNINYFWEGRKEDGSSFDAGSLGKDVADFAMALRKQSSEPYVVNRMRKLDSMTFEEFKDLVYDYGLNDRDKEMLDGLSRWQKDCVDSAWDSIGSLAMHSEGMESMGMDGVPLKRYDDGIKIYFDKFTHPEWEQDRLSEKKAETERYVAGELSRLFPDLELRYEHNGFNQVKNDAEFTSAYVARFDVLRKDGEKLGSLRFRFRFNPEVGEFSFSDKNGLGIMSGSGVLGTDAFVGYFERNGVFCQDATKYGFDTPDAMSREGYLVVGKKDGKPVLRNVKTGKSAFIADGFVPSIQDVDLMPGAKEANLFGSVSHSGLQVGDKVRAVNHFPVGHTEEGIAAGHVVEGIIDDFDGHNVYVRSGDDTFRIDRRQWDVSKSEKSSLSVGSSVVSEKEEPKARDVKVFSAAVPVQKADIPVKKEEKPLVKDLGSSFFGVEYKQRSKNCMASFLTGALGSDFYFADEIANGISLVFKKNGDGKDIEAKGIYVLHDSTGWEVRKRTPYVDLLLRGDRNIGLETGYV